MGFLKDLRRARILRGALLGEEVWADVLAQHPIFNRLSLEERARLRELATLFLRERTFEGTGGFELDEFSRAVIAAQACLPILGLDPDWYSGWRYVVVSRRAEIRDNVEEDSASVVHEYRSGDQGSSHSYGSVTLSWKNVRESGRGDGYNVVIHEAAHILDGRDGAIDGRPPLHEGMNPTEWLEVFSRAYDDLRRRTRKRGKSRPRIDEYAAENDSEFFAVASEHFFETPRLLRGEYPDVYRLLAAFYRQDPLGRRIPP